MQISRVLASENKTESGSHFTKILSSPSTCDGEFIFHTSKYWWTVRQVCSIHENTCIYLPWETWKLVQDLYILHYLLILDRMKWKLLQQGTKKIWELSLTEKGNAGEFSCLGCPANASFSAQSSDSFRCKDVKFLHTRIYPNVYHTNTINMFLVLKHWNTIVCLVFIRSYQYLYRLKDISIMLRIFS